MHIGSLHTSAFGGVASAETLGVSALARAVRILRPYRLRDVYRTDRATYFGENVSVDVR